MRTEDLPQRSFKTCFEQLSIPQTLLIISHLQSLFSRLNNRSIKARALEGIRYITEGQDSCRQMTMTSSTFHTINSFMDYKMGVSGILSQNLQLK